jgi:hypothetical protein
MGEKSPILVTREAPVGRVTRLSDFSPLGQLLIWASFCKLAEMVQLFGQLFSMVQVRYVSILTKKGIGPNFWRLFLQLIWSPACGPAVDCFFPGSSGLPDFSGSNIPKRRKIYHATTKFPNANKIYKMAVMFSKLEKIYSNIFHSKALKNLTKLEFWV